MFLRCRSRPLNYHLRGCHIGKLPLYIVPKSDYFSGVASDIL